MPHPTINTPRTWVAGDAINTDRLRADPGNEAWLQTAKPLFLGAQFTTGTTMTAATVTPLPLDTEYLDDWGGHSINQSVYNIPLPGYYLCEGDVGAINVATTDTITAGIQSVHNTVPLNVDGGKVSGTGTTVVRPACCDLVSLSPATNDTVALYGNPNGANYTVNTAHLKAEWVAAQAGTVISSPPVAAAFPPGNGTTITNGAGISAGATSMTVASTTGMIIGGTLGLDYLDGVATSPTPESVTITNIAGLTVSISATLYSHAFTAPVSVPVSAAFLNQQFKQIIQFMNYPPIAKLQANPTSQSIPVQTFPAGTAITWTNTLTDNFSGFAGGNPTRYTFPVSGVYFIYGAAFLNSANSYTMNAGYAISGGTINWGTTVRNNGATSRTMCATVRHGAVRVTAGQYVEIYVTQNSAGAIILNSASPSLCTLITVFRGF